MKCPVCLEGLRPHQHAPKHYIHEDHETCECPMRYKRTEEAFREARGLVQAALEFRAMRLAEAPR